MEKHQIEPEMNTDLSPWWIHANIWQTQYMRGALNVGKDAHLKAHVTNFNLTEPNFAPEVILWHYNHLHISPLSVCCVPLVSSLGGSISTLRKRKAHFLATWDAFGAMTLLPSISSARLRCLKSVNCKAGRAQARKSPNSCSPSLLLLQESGFPSSTALTEIPGIFFLFVCELYPWILRSISTGLIFNSSSTSTSESILYHRRDVIWSLWWIFQHFTHGFRLPVVYFGSERWILLCESGVGLTVPSS